MWSTILYVKCSFSLVHTRLYTISTGSVTKVLPKCQQSITKVFPKCYQSVTKEVLANIQVDCYVSGSTMSQVTTGVILWSFLVILLYVESNLESYPNPTYLKIVEIMPELDY